MMKGDTPNPGTPAADPLIGRTLNGRFSILEPLGVGGMGKVYRALQAPLDRVVALKVLNPTFQSSRDPGFQKRFLREASLTSKLRHPNTVTVIDYGQTDDGIYYIAMEYLEGRTLAQLLAQQGPLPWSRAISIAQQVCRSLREAHSMGIVHRDLKPANIILLNESDQDLVKVLDFGLVKSIAPAQEAAPSPEITQNGTFLGSPQYMAPEQARNEADARSDVYSLGVVLYQMLMGRPPFISRDHIELIFSHCKEAPPTFASVRPDLGVPSAIEGVVRKCMEKEPARRFQTMDEMLDALREANAVAGGHSGIFKRPGGVTTTGPYPSPLFASVAPAAENPAEHTLAVDISVEVPPAVARARNRKLAVLGLLGLVGVGGVGAGAFFLMRKGAQTPAAETPVAAAPVEKKAEPAPEPPPPPGTKMVRFRLMSQPTGARVFYKGKERGITPFVLEVPQGPDGGVTAELTFALEGYQTETVITGGSGEVVLSQPLKKRRGGAGGRVELAGGSAGVDDLMPAEAMPASMSAPERITAPAPAPTEAKGTGAGVAPGAIGAAAAAPAIGSLGVPTLPTHVKATGNGPLPYSEGMGRPEQLEGKDIVYTREALAAKVQGQMLVKCTISEQGRVQNCRVLKSVPHMEEAVLESLKSRVYKPITYQGRVVAVDYLFNIRLMLPRR